MMRKLPAKESLLQKFQRFAELKRALKLVWQSAPALALADTALMGLQGLLPVLQLWLTKVIIDAITNDAVNFAPEDRIHQVLLLIALAGALVMFQALCRSIAELLSHTLAEHVTDRIYTLLHAKSIEVDLQYYEQAHYHDTLHRAQQEAPSRPLGILNNLLGLGRNLIGLLSMLGLLFASHWGSALLLLAAVSPYVIVRVRYAEKYHQWQCSRTALERRSWYFSWLLSGQEHAKEVRLFDLGPLFIRRFRESRKLLRKERLQLTARNSVFEFFVQCGAILAMFAAYGGWAIQTVHGRMTIGALIVSYQAFHRGQNFLRGALGQVAALYEDSLSLLSLYEFLDLPSQVSDPPKPKPLPASLQEGIRFEGVRFRYPGASHNALENLCLHIRPGETVALVGENGAGKSTLAKLLCRLYDPDRGRILLDGIDLREFRATDLRREINVLFQDYAHYNLTAKENIRLGDLGLPPESEQIRHAAILAGADEQIRRLPHGYESVLGKWFEDGEELSVGEWQKIALARAFLRKSGILVLDEPSSSMDAEAEHRLFMQFRNVVRKQTTILISHRFSTVRMADRIYVLEKGRVLECGGHDELLRRGGRYAHLFELQAQQYH